MGKAFVVTSAGVSGVPGRGEKGRWDGDRRLQGAFLYLRNPALPLRRQVPFLKSRVSWVSGKQSWAGRNIGPGWDDFLSLMPPSFCSFHGRFRGANFGVQRDNTVQMDPTPPSVPAVLPR